MASAYVERLVRFAVGLLMAAILLAVVVRTLPGGGPMGMDMDVSWRFNRPVDEVISEHLRFTWKTVGLGVGVGLPMALLLGIPAGLRPGTLLDRGLQGLVVALMGIPAFALLLVAIRYLVLVPSTGAISIQETVRDGLVVIWAAWMARAVRNGVAGARAGGAATGLRMVASVAGRILQQAGNLAVFLMVAELVGALPGVLRLLLDALYQRDLPVAVAALWAVVPMVLVAHLIGDLLVTYGEGEGRPALPLCRVWLITGGVMAAVLLVTAMFPGAEFGGLQLLNRVQPPGTPGHPLGTDMLGRDVLGMTALGARTSLTITAIALIIATVGGAVLGSVAGVIGRWGGVLSPRVAVPGLWMPIFVAFSILLLNRPSLWITAVALGAASIPAMATGFRWLVRQQVLGRGRPALFGLAGTLVLVAAQILLAEFILGYFGLGAMPPVQGLGGVLTSSIAMFQQAPWVLFPAVPAALGSAGLFLVGHALTDAAGTRLEGGSEAEQGVQTAS